MKKNTICKNSTTGKHGFFSLFLKDSRFPALNRNYYFYENAKNRLENFLEPHKFEIRSFVLDEKGEPKFENMVTETTV